MTDIYLPTIDAARTQSIPVAFEVPVEDTAATKEVALTTPETSETTWHLAPDDPFEATVAGIDQFDGRVPEDVIETLKKHDSEVRTLYGESLGIIDEQVEALRQLEQATITVQKAKIEEAKAEFRDHVEDINAIADAKIAEANAWREESVRAAQSHRDADTNYSQRQIDTTTRVLGDAEALAAVESARNARQVDVYTEFMTRWTTLVETINDLDTQRTTLTEEIATVETSITTIEGALKELDRQEAETHDRLIELSSQERDERIKIVQPKDQALRGGLGLDDKNHVSVPGEQELYQHTVESYIVNISEDEFTEDLRAITNSTNIARNHLVVLEGKIRTKEHNLSEAKKQLAKKKAALEAIPGRVSAVHTELRQLVTPAITSELSAAAEDTHKRARRFRASFSADPQDVDRMIAPPRTFAPLLESIDQRNKTLLLENGTDRITLWTPPAYAEESALPELPTPNQEYINAVETQEKLDGYVAVMENDTVRQIGRSLLRAGQNVHFFVKNRLPTQEAKPPQKD